MTLVATWVNFENERYPSLWSIADTKVANGLLTLTEEGAKVLELHVNCKQYSGNDYGQVKYRTSLGFAYAGSTLVGLNTYAALNTILCNLGAGYENRMRPDYHSILGLAKNILKVYTTSIRSLGEISIWGFCPKTNKAFIGSIKPIRLLDQIDYEISVKDIFSDDLEVMLLGSHTEKIKQFIDGKAQAHRDKRDHIYWRLPITVLSEIIETNEYQEIGGNIQLTTIDNHSFGFTHYAVINSNRHDLPLYRNIDLYREVGNRVGDCIIGMPAMIINEKDFPTM